MKKQSIFLRFLLLVLISQISLPLSFGQRLKNEITHLRVIGEDKSLTNRCEDLFSAEDELLIEVSVSGLHSDGSHCDDCPLPTACIPMYVAAYNFDTGDFLGVSEQITTFSPVLEPQDCNGIYIGQPLGCSGPIFSTQVEIPINLSAYCSRTNSCKSITIHYELVTPNNVIPGKKWMPYTEAANVQGCSLILFPVDCFCHYEGGDPVEEQDKALQTIKYICPTDGPEDPIFTYTKETTSLHQSQASVANQNLVQRSQQIGGEWLPKVYPNPTTDYLLIDFHNRYNSPITVQLLNGEGKVILSSENIQLEGKNPFRLDTSKLPAGLYFCRIYDGKSISSQKIMKLGR